MEVTVGIPDPECCVETSSLHNVEFSGSNGVHSRHLKKSV